MSCNKHESESKESTYVKKTVTDAKKDETSLNYEQKEDHMPVSDFSYHSEEQNKTKEIQSKIPATKQNISETDDTNIVHREKEDNVEIVVKNLKCLVVEDEQTIAEEKELSSDKFPKIKVPKQGNEFKDTSRSDNFKPTIESQDQDQPDVTKIKPILRDMKNYTTNTDNTKNMTSKDMKEEIRDEVHKHAC